MSAGLSDRACLVQSQAALFGAIFGQAKLGPDERSEFNRRGLAVYRRGLYASADRALRISYPTVHQLLGEAFFATAAAEYVKAFPLSEGDWGAWGGGFGEWLAQSEALVDYPYLQDTAALDWACHCCERSADRVAELSSLEGLATADPYLVRLRLGAGVNLVISKYPVVDIWQAHQREGDSGRGLLTQAKEKLQSATGQTALVWRKEWKAKVRVVGEAEQLWLETLLRGRSLGDALDQVQGQAFAFESWLPAAIEERIIIGIENFGKG